MKRISASIMALIAILIAATLIINVYKPESHEQLSESPTGRQHEIKALEHNGFDVIYDKQRQQVENERKAKRQQALEEAQRLYDIKIAEEQRRQAEAKQQAERQRLEAQQRQRQVSRSNDANITQLTMLATHYTARCEGCSGITATGIDVSRTIYANGLRVIAVDPRVIPLGSIVRVEYADGTTFKAIAADVGGAIKNRRIDVLVASKDEAYRLGKQTVTVTILKNGKGR